jgi:hypothetical protein
VALLASMIRTGAARSISAQRRPSLVVAAVAMIAR